MANRIGGFPFAKSKKSEELTPRSSTRSRNADIAEANCRGSGSGGDGSIRAERVVVGQDSADQSTCGAAEFDANEVASRSEDASGGDDGGSGCAGGDAG
jgi:hypothetical protein